MKTQYQNSLCQLNLRKVLICLFSVEISKSLEFSPNNDYQNIFVKLFEKGQEGMSYSNKIFRTVWSM